MTITFTRVRHKVARSASVLAMRSFMPERRVQSATLCHFSILQVSEMSSQYIAISGHDKKISRFTVAANVPLRGLTSFFEGEFHLSHIAVATTAANDEVWDLSNAGLQDECLWSPSSGLQQWLCQPVGDDGCLFVWARCWIQWLSKEVEPLMGTATVHLRYCSDCLCDTWWWSHSPAMLQPIWPACLASSVSEATAMGCDQCTMWKAFLKGSDERSSGRERLRGIPSQWHYSSALIACFKVLLA